MGLTMLQVFKKHIDCFDFTKEPDWQDSAEARQMYYERQQEREQAASEYVSSVLAGNDNWAADINEDANELALSFQRIMNKAERQAYKDAAGQFLLYVASALREHRVMQLSPVSRYRMGRYEKAMNVISGLSKDEAKKEYQKMKQQGFSNVQLFPADVFPATYTVFGYEPQNNAHSGTKGKGAGSNTTNPEGTPPTENVIPQDTTDTEGTPPAENVIPEEWLSGKPKEVLDEAVKCGLAEKRDDGYYWIKGDPKKGWQTGLYGYFVVMVCEQLNWKTGKAERLDWKKFKSVFKNHDEIVGTAKQTVHNYQKGKGIPTLYEKVDKLIKEVFDVEVKFTPKPF